MVDREKVIKGLEWCMNEEHDCYREKGCPYENVGDDIGCKYALHRDASTLLKAQGPGKVNITNSTSDGWKEGNCPFCGMKLDSFYNWSFCGTCGRAVKWE